MCPICELMGLDMSDMWTTVVGSDSVRCVSLICSICEPMGSDISRAVCELVGCDKSDM